MAKTPAQKAAEAKAAADARAKTAAQAAQNAAKAKAKPAPAAAPAPAQAAAAPAAGTPAPAQPERVDPFFTADDLDAINAFNTDLATKLVGLDFDLQNLETDTTYQKTQNDSGAVKGMASAQDDAVARGIFTSSIKDANLFDIEAQRSLAAKFLDDKLTSARLTAGTNKIILGTAKTNFDANMLIRKKNNATGVNDANSSAWAAAQAAWASAQPAAAPAAPAAPLTPAAKPAATTAKNPNTLFAPTPTNKATPSPSRPNVATGTGNTSTKPRKVTTKVVYGNRP